MDAAVEFLTGNRSHEKDFDALLSSMPHFLFFRRRNEARRYALPPALTTAVGLGFMNRAAIFSSPIIAVAVVVFDVVVDFERVASSDRREGEETVFFNDNFSRKRIVTVSFSVNR